MPLNARPTLKLMMTKSDDMAKISMTGAAICVRAHPERLYLIPVTEFPEPQDIWPQTLALPSYEWYAPQDIAALFGMGEASIADARTAI